MSTPKIIRLLLVDDEVELLEVMKFRLEIAKYHVTTAKSGDDAFALLQKNEFDLVLSDVRMPNGDGIELLKNIRNVHPTKPVVLLITGHADVDERLVRSMGATELLSKPIPAAELLAVIARYVQA